MIVTCCGQKTERFTTKGDAGRFIGFHCHTCGRVAVDVPYKLTKEEQQLRNAGKLAIDSDLNAAMRFRNK
jgi:hypothetical protein